MRFKPLNNKEIGKVIYSGNCSGGAIADYENQLEEQCRRANRLAKAALDMSRMPKDAEDEANQFYQLNRAVSVYLGEEDEG